MKFTDLSLHPTLLEALSYMNFEDATPIQVQAIPEILNGKDLIACAQTGTGKTAAFVLPILNGLVEDHKTGTTTLIVCPTRELAIQIHRQIEGFAYFTSASSFPIYGGGDGDTWEQQKAALVGGVDIIVATPGKLISHLGLGYVKLKDVKHLILDEADRMMDMGFVDDINKIISYLPKKRQNLMFSATMSGKIKELMKTILTDPVEISITISKPAEGVLQAAYLTYEGNKTKLINRLIADKPNYQSILIFSSTKAKVKDIIRSLKNKNYDVEGISSDLEQKEREAVLQRFKAKKTRVLVGTDVVSRGIDIKDINLVINFDLPSSAEDYVHRVGRTARANTTGVALTLVDQRDMLKFHEIEQLIGMEVMKLPTPSEIGDSPEWSLRRPKPRFSGGGKKNFRSGGNRKPKRK